MNHWYVNESAPVAATVSVALEPLAIDWLCGCVEIVSAGVGDVGEPRRHAGATAMSTAHSKSVDLVIDPRMMSIPGSIQLTCQVRARGEDAQTLGHPRITGLASQDCRGRAHFEMPDAGGCQIDGANHNRRAMTLS